VLQRNFATVRKAHHQDFDPGRKQFANRVEAADITKSSRRSQDYFFMNVNLR